MEYNLPNKGAKSGNLNLGLKVHTTMKMPFFLLAGLLLLMPVDYARAGSITVFTGEILDISGTSTQTSPTSLPPISFNGLVTVGSMVTSTDWNVAAFSITGLGSFSVSSLHLDPSDSTAFGTASIAYTGSGDSFLLTLTFTDGNNSTDLYTNADLTTPANTTSGTLGYTVAAVPEPSSGILLFSGLGLAALAAAGRKVLI